MSASDEAIDTPPTGRGGRKKKFAILVVVMAIASILARLIGMGEIEQTAALFIFLPATLAVLLAYTGRPKSATVAICKGMAMFLLLSGVVLGEGLICILMAAPLFFAVGILIGFLIDFARHRKSKSSATTLKCSLALIALLSLEGVHDSLSFNRECRVTVQKEIDAPKHAVRAALAAPMNFDAALGTFLRAGFPTPVAVSGSGLHLGALRDVTFSNPSNSHLIFEVTEASDSTIVFTAREDTTKIAHWLGWQRATVTLTALDEKRTAIQWTLDYERRLDPAWYFGPMERYAVGEAARYLIDTLATPSDYRE